uniref:BED-type domain-containing protein n=1 Tax=Parastrongyloides trichosuri TaxID=131310 RepID=A0A0N4ZBG6_PARTI
MFSGISNSMPANQLSSLPFPFFNQPINGQSNRNNQLNFNISNNNPSQLFDMNNSSNSLTGVQVAQQLNLIGNLQKFYMSQANNEPQNSFVESFKKLVSDNKWDPNILASIQCNGNLPSYNILGNNSNLIFNNSLSAALAGNNNTFDNTQKSKNDNNPTIPTPSRRGHRSRGGTTQKTAKVWRFFDELTSSEEQAATCKICSKTIKATNSSTTGMIRHLRSCHHDEYQLLQEARLTSMLEKVGKLDDKNETIKSMFEDPSTAIVELQKQQQNDLKKNLIGNDSLIKLIAAKISAKNEPDNNKLVGKKEENCRLSPLAEKIVESSNSPDNLKPVEDIMDFTMKSLENVNIPMNINLFPEVLKQENDNCVGQKRNRGNSSMYSSSTSNDTDEETFSLKRKYNKRNRKVPPFDETTETSFLEGQNITHAILLWCSMDEMELESLYRKGFVNFIKTAVPHYKLPELSQMKILLRKIQETDTFSNQFHQASNLLQLPCIFNKDNDNIDNTVMHSPTATVTSVGTTSSTISNSGLPLAENYDVHYSNLSDGSPAFNSNDEGSEKTASPELMHDGLNNTVLMNAVRNQYHISNNFSHSIDLINEKEQEKCGTDSESISSVDSEVSSDEKLHQFLKSLEGNQDNTLNFNLLKNVLLVMEFVKSNEEISSILTNGAIDTSINESINSKYTMDEIVKYLTILHSITFIVTHWEKLSTISTSNCLPFEFTSSNKKAIQQIYEQITE